MDIFNLYQAFGLIIQSSLSLPELTPVTQPKSIDVIIQNGSDEESKYLETNANKLLLKIPNVANFLIEDGAKITIDRIPAASDDDVKLFLLGSAMGALLQQRKFLVLHGNAIAIKDNKATIFIGNTGVGKSTLAGAFYKRGYSILADDVCAISVKDDIAFIIPSFPQIKLTPATLEKLSIDTTGLRKIHMANKYAIDTKHIFNPQPIPIATIYQLQTNSENSFQEIAINGANKFHVLKENSYRFYFLLKQGRLMQHFQIATQVAKNTPIKIISRPKDNFLLSELVDYILCHQN